MAAQSSYKFLNKTNRTCVPLYKYYSNYDYAKDAINNNRIHIEQPSDYNDVYDSAFYLTASSLKRVLNTSHNLCRILKTILPSKYYSAIEDCYAKVDEKQFSVEDAIDYLCTFNSSFSRDDLTVECILGLTQGKLMQADNNKISCFSECNNSLLMWAYYADNAKGVCLGYDINSDAVLSKYCHKVEYSDHFVLDTPGFDAYFRKSEQWSHELEWRIVCNTTEDYIPTMSLRAIILGCRTPNEICQEFLVLAKEKQLDVYRVKPSIKKYELLLDPLHICSG